MTLKYGNRNVPKMIRDWSAFQDLVRSQGSPEIQEAFDKLATHVDYAYRVGVPDPEKVARILYPDDVYIGPNCMKELDRVGQVCRICEGREAYWNTLVDQVREALIRA
jgi:hypothetical protein